MTRILLFQSKPNDWKEVQDQSYSLEGFLVLNIRWVPTDNGVIFKSAFVNVRLPSASVPE